MDIAPPRIGLLHGFHVSCGTREVQLPISAQRLLAFLALQARPVRRLYVAGSLWLELSEESANSSLRTVLWRLRRTHPALVDAGGGMLSLGPGVTVDLSDASVVARRILAGDADIAPGQEASLFVAGDLLPDWYEDWVTIERERFRQLRLHALEVLCERLTEAGRFAQAAQAAFAAVASEPLRETAHRALIRLHVAQGNRSEAVRHLELYRRVLDTQLGLALPRELEQLARGLPSAA